MNRRTLALSLSAAALAGLAALSAPAVAKPTTPEPAMPSSGSGCLVSDANGVYHSDPSCSFHVITQRDGNGRLLMYQYQDQGQLPAGAPVPTSAIHHDFVFGNQRCSETTAPSGQYSSRCTYQNR